MITACDGIVAGSLSNRVIERGRQATYAAFYTVRADSECKALTQLRERLMATATQPAKAEEFPTRMYIDGKWCGADSGKTLDVINPADESVLAKVAYGTRAEADRAIEAAARAFPGWRAVSAYDRAKILKKTADLMRER